MKSECGSTTLETGKPLLANPDTSIHVRRVCPRLVSTVLRRRAVSAFSVLENELRTVKTAGTRTGRS
jgi:hypothetical protein